ncbi:hypothetical protein [Sorangium sp. So ce590]|uniref:hypothetical protein n=1 Tax=unclassified Sorangium TaxID=2621164 RepID=UPI003F635CCD
MDVYCEVCGLVTTVSGGARGGAAPECRVCGGTMLRAQGRGTAGLPVAGAGRRSSRPPPPLRRSSAPPVPRDDDDPTMMDLRSLALKSFLANPPAPRTAAAALAGSAAAPATGRVAAATPIAAATPVAVDAPPSVTDVLRVYDALAPVAAPSRARHRARVCALMASAAGALAIAAGLALFTGPRSSAPGDVLPPTAQRGVSRAGEVAREVSAPDEAPGYPNTAPPAREAQAPGAGEGEADGAEPDAAPKPAAAVEAGARAATGAGARTASSAGVRALAAAGARAASASGARARPAHPPAPPPASEEAPRPAPPVSLTDAMAAAVAGTPSPAAAQAERQEDTREK